MAQNQEFWGGPRAGANSTDPPITPRPDRRAAAAPALRAVDAILEKLVLGMGLTVRQGHDGVWLVAKPGEVSRDYF